MTMQEMIRMYNNHSASHKYIVGFVRGGKVYYATVSFEKLAEMLKACKASSKRGGFNKVRVYVSAKAQKAMIENGEATEYVQVEAPTYESFTMDFDESLNGDDDTM